MLQSAPPQLSVATVARTAEKRTDTDVTLARALKKVRLCST